MKSSENFSEVLNSSGCQPAEVLNIAFYSFRRVSDLVTERQFLLEVCRSHGVLGTILLSAEGINGSLAGNVENIRELQRCIASREIWSGIEYKESLSTQIPFKRLRVKLKKEIIPSGIGSVDPLKSTAPRVTPEVLKSWLDEKKDILFLDTRNDYEVEHGTFENAVHLGIRNFRDFPEKLGLLKGDQRPMVMFCTGGIRCEKASIAAYQAGFKEVYQLDGGILNYFEKVGGEHYRGTCFVFDERVAVDPALAPAANHPANHNDTTTKREFG